MQGKEAKSYTPYIVIASLAGFGIYKIWQFANQPDALERVLAFLECVGLCLGAFVLFMAVLFLASYLENVCEEKPSPRPASPQYQVNAHRTKPAVDKWGGYGLVGTGAFYALFGFGLCYLSVASLVEEFGSIRTIHDVHLLGICGGLLVVPLAFAMGIGSTCMFVEGVRTHVQNRAWMRGAVKARATIVDRWKEQIITTLDYRYGGSTMTYNLVLQVKDQPGVVEFEGRFIHVDVGKRIFKRYARKDSVVIHYANHSPLTFILRGE
jgi:predicted permease